MLITDLVTGRGHLLTANDRRLVALLQSQPAAASYWLATDLTGPLGLHQSAATRLAQRLGFAGYPELRDALRQDYMTGEGPAQRVRGRLDRHPNGDVIRGFVEDELEALSELTRHVGQSQLDQLAARMVAAGHIFLFGQGNATVLVDLTSRRLQRFGMRVTALSGSRRDVAERVSSLTSADVLVAFAFRRMPAQLAPLLSIAADNECYSVLITDTLLSMSPQPDQLIAAPRGHGDEFLSLTVPMAIVNALVLTVARRQPDESNRSLDRLAHLLDQLDA
ncbi:MurR/RpiR family transcriptional regulator [Rhodococcoides fascians]|uniref:MurR/RpiR family transcriptional regulator n=1 Tax=Rhodococcoides fascians TaxID=1828 RepID=UPI00068DF280|nr:MurR/RpiR family transcriptional regulator [Rhodococcus fascians]